MTEILVPLGFFFAIVAAIKIIADYRTRSKLIERGVSSEEARALLSSPSGAQRASSLKWGLVAAGVGLGFLVVHLTGLDEGEPVTAGVVLLFAGGALLLHYALARRLMSRSQSQVPPQRPDTQQEATHAGGAGA